MGCNLCLWFYGFEFAFRAAWFSMFVDGFVGLHLHLGLRGFSGFAGLHFALILD